MLTSIDYPLSTNSTAFGINDAGELAGFYSDAASNTHGFVHSAGDIQRCGCRWSARISADPIKNDGLVTGVYIDAVNGQHGLIGQ